MCKTIASALIAAACAAGHLPAKAPTGKPKPWQRHIIDGSSRGADGVRLADVNGDGLMDIATGWEEAGIIRVYINPGPKKAKAPWPAVTVGKVKSPEDAVFADLDGDGAMDVVSCCEGRTKTVYVHWAPTEPKRTLEPGAWKTEALPVTAGKQAWMFALPMQIDGRGGVDLVVSSKGSNATIGSLISPKDPRDVKAWTFRPICKAGWIMSLIAADMDHDGDPDVLATDRRGTNRSALWLENPGPASAGSGTWPRHVIADPARPDRAGQYMFLNVGDIDGDHLGDVVAAVKSRTLQCFTRLDKTGLKWRRRDVPMPAWSGTAKGIAVGDVDGDGLADLVFTCEGAKPPLVGAGWIRQVRTGGKTTWRAFDIAGAKGTKFDRIELLDLDKDGDLDVLTCEERGLNAVFWYENPTK